MPIRLTLTLPQHALEKLMHRYCSGDPELMFMLKEFGVLAIQSHDEQALAIWENGGGRQRSMACQVPSYCDDTVLRCRRFHTSGKN